MKIHNDKQFSTILKQQISDIMLQCLTMQCNLENDFE